MNSDATEAALGLLGLSPLNHHIQVFDAHSGTPSHHGHGHHTVPPSLIPLKRKQPSPSNVAKSHPTKLASPLLTTPSPTTTFSHPPLTSPHPSLLSPTTFRSPSLPSHRPSHGASPLSSHPPHANHTHPDPPPSTDADDISCICGFTYDDGFSIACDVCSRWCHAACFGIVEGGVPEEWRCWVCQGGSIDEEQRERAVKLQRKRLKTLKMRNGPNGNVPHPDSVPGEDQPRKPGSRRRTSPGMEKKPRRSSGITTLATDGTAPNATKKRRRASILNPAGPSSSANALAALNANPPTGPDVAHPSSSRISQPSTSSSRITDVFPPDAYSHPSTHAQLLKVAKAWRGVTALNPPIPVVPPRTYIDGGYVRVDSQGYKDRHGYSMSPLDNTTPVIVDDGIDVMLPPTVLKTCPSDASPSSYLCSHVGGNGVNSGHTPPHLLRPPSPKLFVGPTARLPQSSTTSGLASASGTALGTASHGPTDSSRNDTIAIPSNTLLSPYTATILPSSAYLADPLNGYAHLGMGKPQVRLVGGGWCVGVDARELGGRGTTLNVHNKGKRVEGTNGSEEREAGGQKGKCAAATPAADESLGKGRWARCGCWPNAVVRPVICGGARRRKKKGEGGDRESDNEQKARRHRDGCTSTTSTTTNGNGAIHPPTEDDSGAPPPPPSPSDTSSDNEDSTTLSFGLFALRDLRADEEIVLGWEWDDGHAVHMLPALIESPGMFGPAHLHYLRAQCTSILHALSSTFTTCACGSSTRDCAVRVMERVAEGRWPWPGGEASGSEWETDDQEEEEGGGDCNGRMLNVGHGREREGEDVIVDLEATDSEGESGARGMNGAGCIGVTVNCKGPSTNGANSINNPSSHRKRRKKAKDGTNAEKTRHVDLGPLVGVQRGFRTRERTPMSGGWCGVEVVPSSLGWSAGLGGEDEDVYVDVVGNGGGRSQRTSGAKAERNGEVDCIDDGLPGEEHVLPPRMRKPWSQQPGPSRSPTITNAESPISTSSHGKAGHEVDGTSAMETEFDTETEGEDTADDTRQMPPPPMPASLDPTTISSLAHAHSQAFPHPRSSSPHQPSNTTAKNVPDPPRIPPRWMPSRTTSSPQTHSELHIAPVSAGTVQLSQPTPPQPQYQQQQLYSHTLASMSPSVPFSKLSLFSPDGGATISQNGPVLSLSSVSSERSTVDQPSPSTPTSMPSSSYSEARSPCDGTIPPAVQTDDSSPSSLVQDSQADVNRRSSSTETHRVRFVSPEVLGGLPSLTNGNNVHVNVLRDVEDEVDIVGGVDGLDGVNADADTGGNESREVNEAMDVDVDVSGDVSDEQRVTSACSSDHQHPGLENSHGEQRPTHQSGDTSPCTDAPSIPPFGSGSRHEQPLSDQSPQPVDAPMEPETHCAEPQPPHTPTPHHSEPEPEPGPSQPARVPSPPPPPKVKMSLKDFVLRKKKQREEEMAAKSVLSPASPSAHLALPPSPGPVGDESGSSVAEPAEATSTPGERERDEPQIPVTVPDVDLNGDDDLSAVNAPGDVVRTDQDDAAPPEISQQHLDCQELSSSNEPGSCQERGVSVEGCQSSPPPLPPLTPLRVPDESQVIQTQTKGSPVADQASAEKFEAGDDALPNGATGGNDRMHDVVSFAPDPPPPPLNSLAASANHVDSGAAASASLVPVPTPAPTPSSMSTSSTSNSRATSVSASLPTHPSQYPRATYQSSASRRISHEDGEILSSAFSKSYVPRSHTPPTQPRSFQVPRAPSPGYSPGPSSSRRPPPPPPPRSGPGPSSSVGTNALSRPLPSGPRALRGTMNQSSYPPPPPRPYSGSQYIPRGPSADRDRLDRERDRSWSASSRPRGRAGSTGWGR